MKQVRGLDAFEQSRMVTEWLRALLGVLVEIAASAPGRLGQATGLLKRRGADPLGPGEHWKGGTREPEGVGAGRASWAGPDPEAAQGGPSGRALEQASHTSPES